MFLKIPKMEYHCFFKKRNKEGTECKYYTQDNKLINV